MQHRLIIHVGMPKTGTTAIQNFLYNNNNILHKHGYDYPDLIKEMNDSGYQIGCRPEGRKKNGVVLGLFRRWDDWDDINNTYKDAWPVLLGILSDHLKLYNVILSDEDLWSQGNNFEIIRRLKAFFGDIIIVAYLRRQDLAIEALWNQTVKRYGYCEKTFEQSKDRWLNARVLKYSQLLDGFSSIVGEDALNLNVFEKGKFFGNRGDITDDFLHLIGIETIENWIHEDLANERLTGSFLNIKLAMNRSLSKEDWFSGFIEEYFLDYVSKNDRMTNEVYLTDDERKKVIKMFENENRYIAKKYFKVNKESIFSDYESYSIIHNNSISIDDVVSVFTHIFMEQEKKLYHATKELLNNTNYKVGMSLKGRKLTVFGAGEKCKQFLEVINLPVDSIVDTDESKKGEFVNGIKVNSAREIDNWKDRYVIVASSAYGEIKELLLTKGLVEKEDFDAVWNFTEIV